MSEYRLFKVIRTDEQKYFDIEYVCDVVTCRECNEWNEYARDELGRCDCHLITTRADDFCSYGERKGE